MTYRQNTSNTITFDKSASPTISVVDQAADTDGNNLSIIGQKTTDNYNASGIPGNIIIQGGDDIGTTSGGKAGDVTIKGGSLAAGNTGQPGDVYLTGGDADSTYAGSIYISSGTSTSDYPGDVNISTPEGGLGSGGFFFKTGNVNSNGDSGSAQFATGNSNASGGNSGSLTFSTGASGFGNSGSISMAVGGGFASSSTSGDIDITIADGGSVNGTGGHIFMKAGKGYTSSLVDPTKSGYIKLIGDGPIRFTGNSIDWAFGQVPSSSGFFNGSLDLSVCASSVNQGSQFNGIYITTGISPAGANYGRGIFLRADTSTPFNNGHGGNIVAYAGNTSAGEGGSLDFKAGFGSTLGGLTRIQGGGLFSPPADGYSAGNVELVSGSSTSGNNNSGNIKLTIGTKTGTGIAGAVFINNATSIELDGYTKFLKGTNLTQSIITSNTTLSSTLNALSSIYALNAGITLTLPATPTSGTKITFYDHQGNATSSPITIDSNSLNINGTSTYSLSTNYSAVTLYYNGTTWFVISKS